MKTVKVSILLSFLMLMVSLRINAQNMKIGDNIIECLGKSISSDPVNLLMDTFKMKDDIPGVKAGNGLTFYAPSGYIQRITFQNNKTYGHFSGVLPFGLSMKDDLKELKSKFPNGKETEEYYKFSTGNYSVEIKFTSAKKKSIEFVAVL